MIVNLNGKPVELPEGASLKAVLQTDQLRQGGIALAVNNQVVPRNDWGSYMLQENDLILFIRASQGG